MTTKREEMDNLILEIRWREAPTGSHELVSHYGLVLAHATFSVLRDGWVWTVYGAKRPFNGITAYLEDAKKECEQIIGVKSAK